MMVTILICSIHLSIADCQSNTAERMIPGPEVKTEQQCGFVGMAYAAQQPVVQAELAKGNRYPKIQCVETSIGQGDVG